MKFQRRIDYTVQHSPYTISEEEYREIEEYEYSLSKDRKFNYEILLK